MDWSVHVPTYRRAQVLATKTLRALRDAGHDGPVHVWLSDPDERPHYTDALRDAGWDLTRVLVRDGRPGLAANRRHAMAGYPTDARLVFVDDDVAGFDQLDPHDDGKLQPVTHLPELIDALWATCRQVGARLWGVYPVRNAFYMRRAVSTDLRLITGCFYGIQLAAPGGADWQHVDGYAFKEDTVRTVQHYLTDGAVVRWRSVTYRQRHNTATGGLGEQRTPQAVEAEARDIAARWPRLCTLWHRGDGRPELRLADRRPT